MARVNRHTGLTMRGSLLGIGVVVGATAALTLLFFVVSAVMTLVAE